MESICFYFGFFVFERLCIETFFRIFQLDYNTRLCINMDFTNSPIIVFPQFSFPSTAPFRSMNPFISSSTSPVVNIRNNSSFCGNDHLDRDQHRLSILDDPLASWSYTRIRRVQNSFVSLGTKKRGINTKFSFVLLFKFTLSWTWRLTPS